jgi:hypothetical protein
MPSWHARNVSVTEHLARFVARQVAGGRFSSASEVVRACLRLLKRDQAAVPPGDTPADGGGAPPGPSTPGFASQKGSAP